MRLISHTAIGTFWEQEVNFISDSYWKGAAFVNVSSSTGDLEV